MVNYVIYIRRPLQRGRRKRKLNNNNNRTTMRRMR